MSTSEIAKLESRWRENPKGLTFAPLAEAYRKQKDPVRALEILQPGLERNPDYIPANIVLGRCHWDLNDLPAAEKAFTHVLGLDSENVIALKALADITERVCRFDEAERWLQELLAVDRSNEEAREQLARVRALREQQAQGSPALPGEPIADLAADVPLVLSAFPTAPEPTPRPRAADAPVAAQEPAAPVEPPMPEVGAIEPSIPDFAGFDSQATEERDAGGDARQEAARDEPFLPEITLSYSESTTSYQSEETDSADTFAAPVEDQPERREHWRMRAESFGIEQIEQAEDIVLNASGASEFQVPSAAEEFLDRHRGAEPRRTEEAEPTPEPIEAERRGESGYDEGRHDESHESQRDVEPPVWAASPRLFEYDDVPPTPVPSVEERIDAPVAEPEPSHWEIPAARGYERYAHEQRHTHAPDDLVEQEQEQDDEMAEPELVVTETMAKVFLKQGHLAEALTVYRELRIRAPDDSYLLERIETLEALVAAATPARRSYAARDTGGRSVAAFFEELLAAHPDATSSERPAAPPPAEPAGSSVETPAAPEPEPSVGFGGAPTRPAGDALSLGSVFGEEPPAVTPAMPPLPTEPQPGGPTPGVSFDDFFTGGKVAGANAGAAPGRPSRARGDDDLDQFHNWLQGLKR